MLKRLLTLIGFSVLGCTALSSSAAAQACPTTSLANGNTADATQVMAWINCKAPIINPTFSTASGLTINLVNTTATDYTQFAFNATGRQWNVGVGNTSAAYGVANKLYVFDSAANAMRLVIDTSGHVGIGTAAPSLALSVQTATQYDGMIIGNGTHSIASIFGSATGGESGTIQLSNAGVVAVQLSAGNGANSYINYGSLGIGTTTPATKLAVVGDIRVGTSGTLGCIQNFSGAPIMGTCSSDAALKTIVGSVGGVLNKLARLQLVTYHWNETAARVYANSTTALNTGFIAQDVERQFPGLVSKDSRGYRRVDYTTLSLYGLEAIKELRATIDVQAAEIRKLKAERRNEIADQAHLTALFDKLKAKISPLLQKVSVRTAAE